MLLFFSDCIDYGKIVIFIIMIHKEMAPVDNAILVPKSHIWRCNNNLDASFPIDQSFYLIDWSFNRIWIYVATRVIVSHICIMNLHLSKKQ